MKKKIFMIILVVVLLGISTPVLAKNIASCDTAISTNVIIDQRIPEVVSTIITVIKIAVPVLLVIFGMLDLFKGLSAQKEDEIKKGQQMFIKRLISGALVFFVFIIVQLIVSLAAGGENGESKTIMDCADCFINNNCEYRLD